ncbi:lipoyl(octanoyl) transferase LipB [Salicola sp. Rm-C-2C1-2]|uniref:lipoyl(octanoyl) transferase LipB n=1 Tax=Salicola sp. Rm-C-2C1-2 TaxID=3141321 RepID=UPI0032E3E4D1
MPEDSAIPSGPRVEWLGRRRYQPILEAMKAFTDARDHGTPDACWLLEHEPVFTQGQAGRAEHILMPGDIPVVQVDRGGQVTYHGPGQLMVYTLIDIRRRGLGVRQLVSLLEDTTVAALAHWDIEAAPRQDAPGVYVAGEKIASLGLRVRRGCAYHGLALNVDMDLAPFQRINPCGYAGMPVTQIRDQIGGAVSLDAVSDIVQRKLLERLQLAGSE